MTEPTDRELLEFIARFAGWRDVGWMSHGDLTPWLVGKIEADEIECVPDYLSSVDAWLRDVWPKVQKSGILHLVCQHVLNISGYDCRGTLNFVEVGLQASARDRCLALWRALDEKLPEEKL